MSDSVNKKMIEIDLNSIGLGFSRKRGSLRLSMGAGFRPCAGFGVATPILLKE